MILEVGAGGCIMITPPAKGSQLERDMNGEKIGGVTVGSIQFENADKSPEYARYMRDVHKLNELGQIQRDVNGNWIFLHRAGDVMLDVNGQPLLVTKPAKESFMNALPKVNFSGIRDGGLSRPCGRQHVGAISEMDHDEFNVVFQEVTAEAKRRLAGGQPLTEDDYEDTLTVASI
jgi:hypothetical protein